MPKRFLIIRFSSIGDIIQASPVPFAIKKKFPQAHITWLTRDDMRQTVDLIENVDEVWEFPRRSGLPALLQTTWSIHRGDFDYVYDAHNNLRSNVIMLVLHLLSFFGGGPLRAQRSKNRWQRFLFFRLRRPVFKMPFKGSISFLEPLAPWGIQIENPADLPATLKNKPDPSQGQPVIALIPGAAWETKTWPREHFIHLIRLLPNFRFWVFGGNKESELCAAIAATDPTRVENLAGKYDFKGSVEKLAHASAVVGNDTGLTHAADHMGLDGIFLIGPTAFGYPLRKKSMVAEISLDCKPCSKDGRTPCTNSVAKRCLVELTPAHVKALLDSIARQQRWQ